MTDFIRDIMIRQGGLRFWWRPGTRCVSVRTPAGVERETLGVGNIFDSRPADLDEVHDAVDGYCDREGLSGI